MSTAPANFDWKNPAHLAGWKAKRESWWKEFRRRHALPDTTPKLAEQQISGEFIPHREGVALAYKPGSRQNRIEYFDQGEAETLSDRITRLDAGEGIAARRAQESARFYSTLTLIGRKDGEIVLAPAARIQPEKKRSKAMRMFDAELHKKASRELACGVIGGMVHCRNDHKFAVRYECGNRYCPQCGPDRATECFAKILPRLRLATARLLDCGDPNCKACYPFRRGKTRRDDGDSIPIPHWPDRKPGSRVIAILDFMLPKVGAPDRFTARRFNAAIKKTIRTLTRRAGTTRTEYGYLFTDEYGAKNTNLHAHGIWVGPSLDQKEIGRIWRKAIGSRYAVFTIRLCDQLEPALFHAIKYPAKFGELAEGEWLAELEIAFHRVRRLHRLGAFYNMPKAADEPEPDGRMKKCPHCGEPLTEPTFNRLLGDLRGQGMRDLRAVLHEIPRARTFNGGGLSP